MKKTLSLLILLSMSTYSANVTQTLRQSGGDYTSLITFLNIDTTISADDTLFLDVDEIWTKGDTIGELSIVDGWTNDGVVYVRGLSVNRHNGTWCDTCYYVVDTSDSGPFLWQQLGGDWIFEGLQFKDINTFTGLNNGMFIFDGPRGTFSIFDCIFEHTSDIFVYLTDANFARLLINIRNSVFYQLSKADNNGNFIHESAEGNYNVNLFNNTILDFDDVYNPNGNSHIFTAKNNLVGGLTGPTTFDIGIDSNSSLSNIWTVEFNTYDDSATTDGNRWGTTNNRNQTFTFIDSSVDNYHLDSLDVGAKNLGADLGLDDNLAWSQDVDMEYRTGSYLFLDGGINFSDNGQIYSDIPQSNYGGNFFTKVGEDFTPQNREFRTLLRYPNLGAIVATLVDAGVTIDSGFQVYTIQVNNLSANDSLGLDIFALTTIGWNEGVGEADFNALGGATWDSASAKGTDNVPDSLDWGTNGGDFETNGEGDGRDTIWVNSSAAVNSSVRFYVTPETILDTMNGGAGLILKYTRLVDGSADNSAYFTLNSERQAFATRPRLEIYITTGDSSDWDAGFDEFTPGEGVADTTGIRPRRRKIILLSRLPQENEMIYKPVHNDWGAISDLIYQNEGITQ